jgi:hypothetical protein
MKRNLFKTNAAQSAEPSDATAADVLWTLARPTLICRPELFLATRLTAGVQVVRRGAMRVQGPVRS